MYAPTPRPRGRPATATPSAGTSGSCPRRCATRSWCWRRRRPGFPAFLCRASGLTARSTHSASSGSRTSSATAQRLLRGEFVEAFAWRVGEEGRGVRTIIEMVQRTRLDCVISSAGMMRLALANALRHAKHRTVFQKQAHRPADDGTLIADLALEFERRPRLPSGSAAASTSRRGTTRTKPPSAADDAGREVWICKSAPAFIYEAMECLGGNGYVEETPLARLCREAPLNAIWEGSGNVMCLDVLRARFRAKAQRRKPCSAIWCVSAAICRAQRKPLLSLRRRSVVPAARRTRALRSKDWPCWQRPLRSPKAHRA